jgi:hypothetical protein
MGKNQKKSWKLHKLLGVSGAIFLLLFSFSGIILNHRQFFSDYDVNRKFLPQYLQVANFNQASFKSTLKVADDSVFVYGDAGIFLSDNKFSKLQDFNFGLQNGVDNKKIVKMFQTECGQLIAAGLFNLYQFDFNANKWMPIGNFDYHDRVVDLKFDGKNYLILTRSNLFKSRDFVQFEKVYLPNYKGYDDKVSAFKTLWVVHSGEIAHLPGKLFVDFMGIVFIVLSVSGILYFIYPSVFKRRKDSGKNTSSLRFTLKESVKWHNKLGVFMGVHLVVLAITGMFLRPPLLIAIANSAVPKLPYTFLDNNSAWFDKLRAIEYDEARGIYFIACTDGIYASGDNFKSKLVKVPSALPISVMGVNVFNMINSNELLVGSFSGLYTLNVDNLHVRDFLSKSQYNPPSAMSSPISDNMISGYSDDFVFGSIYFDYNKGIQILHRKGQISDLTSDLTTNSVFDNKSKLKTLLNEDKINQRISLWNLNLEIHTMRIFQSLIGVFYILLIPISGILTVILLITGYIIWMRKKRILK